MEGLYFGLMDNFVMIIGAFFGLNLERLFSKRDNGLGAVIGAGIGNAISDFLGGVVEGNMSLAYGTALGCMLCLAIIPLFVIIIRFKKPSAIAEYRFQLDKDLFITAKEKRIKGNEGKTIENTTRYILSILFSKILIHKEKHERVNVLTLCQKEKIK